MEQAVHSILSLAKERLNKHFFAFREHTLKKSAHCFTQGFKGDILYAVKTNPEHHILSTLLKSGIHAFDVAPIE
jgi:ornithine decarboxylase